jgi:hypothetical protein
VATAVAWRVCYLLLLLRGETRWFAKRQQSHVTAIALKQGVVSAVEEEGKAAI